MAESVVGASASASTGSVGELIGDRYRIVARLGSGGMADVYRAHDEVLERDVALKILRRELATEADLRRQADEIRILAGLSHPSLVTLYDAVAGGDERGILVLEFVDGADLRTRLRDGPLAPSEAAAIGRDLARGLAYIHHRGVMHRDVSPANVLLPSEERSGVVAKLTDLGIARLVDGSRVTSTGTVMGTAGYLSPEQARGATVTPATDLYSLGLVLLEALTGRREFPGGAVESASARLARDPDVPEGLPDAWRGLLSGLTAREPGDRPSADEAAERLDALRRVPDPAAPPAAAPTPELTRSTADDVTRRLTAATPTAVLPRAASPRPPRPRRAPVRALVIVIVGAIVVAGAIALTLSLVTRTPAPSPTPTASYPAVSGQLGGDLRRLEDAVDPG